MSASPYLAFCGIGKQFPGVKALHDISFTCQEGTVHALMGENGAGKSTLLKILSGNYSPSEGELRINNQVMHFAHTTDALNAGVAIIYQELHLLPELSVAENIYLGQLQAKAGFIDQATLRAKTRQQLNHLGMDIDPDTPLKYLSIAQWQMIEIAKALTRDAKIIAFDEPTSSLSKREIEQLFKVIRELRAEGRVILYVSHRMEEIFELCDAITVFKDGCYVTTFDDVQQVSSAQLVQSMVGRHLGDVYGYSARDYGAVRLEVIDLVATGITVPINLTVRQGEIIGLFGLVGAGRSELLKALFGATPLRSGQIKLDGQLLQIQSPIDAIHSGIMLCPEDRKAEGLVLIHSVRDNINISARRHSVRSGFVINEQWEKQNASQQIQDLKIKTPSDQQIIQNLSGGNQQKAILGRWLSEDMKVILLDEPTRGIDVGAKHDIYQIIYQLAEKGVAVIFASSDLPEALGVADRVVVMRNGKIAGELLHEHATETGALSLAMLQEQEV